MKKILILILSLIAVNVSAQISTSSFGSKIDLITSPPYWGDMPLYINSADFNEDNINDIIYFKNPASNTFYISILKNTSSINNPNSSSFANQDIQLIGLPSSAKIADINNDSKLDIIISYAGSLNISILKNISTTNSIIFAPRIDIATTTPPPTYDVAHGSVDVADLDGDNLKEIVITNSDLDAPFNITIFRNTSINSSISFASPIDFSITRNNVLSFSYSLILSDLNNDSKPDIIIQNPDAYSIDNALIIAKNTSTVGNISFGTQTVITNSVPFGNLKVGDFDNDSKTDISVQSNSNTITIFKNTTTSTNTSISFASGINVIVGPSSNYFMQDYIVYDINDDNKLDICTINFSSSTSNINLSVLQNNSTGSSIAFGSNINIYSTFSAYSTFRSAFAFSDIDQNNSPDLITNLQYSSSSSSGSLSISVFQNLITERYLKINLDKVHGLYPYYTNNGQCTPKKLFDEQNIETPVTFINDPNGAYSAPLPADILDNYSIVVELDGYYQITSTDFFNSNNFGGGLLEIEIGDPQGWVSLTNTGNGINTKNYSMYSVSPARPAFYEGYINFPTPTNNSTYSTKYIRITFRNSIDPTFGYKTFTLIKEIKFKGIKIGIPLQQINSPSVTFNPKFGDYLGVTGTHGINVKSLECATSIRNFQSWYWNDGGASTSAPWFFPISSSYNRNNNIYKFQPDYGNRNMDDDYIAKTNAGISVVPVLQESALYMDSGKHPKRKPLGDILNDNPEEKSSYYKHAEFMYQFAARYGSTSVPIINLNAINPLSGLNKVKYIENWNEPNDWYTEYGPQVYKPIYFNPFEFAAMCAADYDYGDNLTLNPGTLGMKAADPNVKMAMGGLVTLDLNYIKAMKLWADNLRVGANSNEKFPADVLNFHSYSNATGIDQTIGISPEADGLKLKLKEIVDYRNKNLPSKEIWLSEFGYDTDPSSVQKTPIITGNGKTTDSKETQGRWIVRSILEIAASKIDKAYCYTIQDEYNTNGGKHMSSGLLENDANFNAPKPSWFYMRLMKSLLKDYVFEEEIQSSNPIINTLFKSYVSNGTVSVYSFKNPQTNEKTYAIWCRTSNNSEVQNFRLDGIVGVNQFATIVTPNLGYGKRVSCINGSFLTLTVSELPQFVEIKNNNNFTTPVYTNNAATINNQTANIPNNLTISANQTLTINDSKLVMSSNNEIIVYGNLIINNSVISGCPNWKGIIVKSSGKIEIKNNSTIRDASVGCYFESADDIVINKSKFINNNVSLVLEKSNSINNNNIVIQENNFSDLNFNITSNFASNDPRSNFQTLNSYIITTNSIPSIVIDDNTFYGFDNCIGCSKPNITSIYLLNTSNVEIKNNRFIAGEKNIIDYAIYLNGDQNTIDAQNVKISDNQFTRTLVGVYINSYKKFWVFRNTFFQNNKSVEIYNSDYTNNYQFNGSDGFYSPVQIITLNKFISCEKGIILAPKMDPFNPSANKTNNFLRPGQSHFLTISCNKFQNVVYGITGVGDLNNQLHQDLTSANPAGIAYTTSNEFIHSENIVKWDIIWNDNGSSNIWRYNLKKINPNHINGDNIYFPNTPALTPQSSSVTYLTNYPILATPTVINGVTIDNSNINQQFDFNRGADKGDLCYYDPFSIYLDGGEFRQLLSSKQKNIFESEFIVYPNPTSDKIYIANIYDNINYQIIDINGKILNNGILNQENNFISLEELNDGIYFINVTLKNGINFKKKIVKITQ